METLVVAKRGSLDEVYHTGSICVVNKDNKIIYSIGDVQQNIFMRSTSKVFQILPFLYYGLEKKYQLSLKEIAIMISSHIGSLEHIDVLKSIMEKTGVKESDFCIKPAYPISFESTKYFIENGIAPSPIFHMCSGKHLGLMLVEKEFRADYQKYYEESSYATKESMKFIALMAEMKQDKIIVGLDGCGVPVFGLPLYHAAIAFKNLTFTNHSDNKLNEAIKIVNEAISTYPEIVRGKDYFCTYHNYDSNVIGKDGAHGYYAFGLKKEHLGIAFKLFSGDMNMFPYVVNHLYSKINYSNDKLLPYLKFEYLNDNEQVIGEYEAIF
ncbi:asparaginase [Erysipelotrichaceae bacterium OttesenSCG-928-M19]|nr:asparaginase [Erysipelotrichaceae bacterium OttesenSCG-928-M19]